MTRTEIKKDMRQALNTQTGFFTVGQICKYVGDSNQGRVKKKYLEGLPRMNKRYSADDVAERLLEAMES